MQRYKLSRKAQDDLEKIIEYSASNFGVKQARLYASQIQQSIQIASEFPKTGRQYSTKNEHLFRQYNCGRHAIFYAERSEHIFVVRILHLRMDIENHLE